MEGKKNCKIFLQDLDKSYRLNINLKECPLNGWGHSQLFIFIKWFKYIVTIERYKRDKDLHKKSRSFNKKY